MAIAPKFAHVVLQTSKLTEMRDWYCALLAGHVVFESGPLSFVTFDEEHHRIAFLAPPRAAGAEVTGGIGHAPRRVHVRVAGCAAGPLRHAEGT
jgi:hypothetical protein